MNKCKSKEAGKIMADSIISFCHLMYQKDTATRVLQVLIDRLNNRKKEFKR